MALFDHGLRSQFFLTGPRPCPYLPDRFERKLFTNLAGPHARALHDELSAIGFRRSQNIAYRPACAGCNACVSTRICASEFAPTRSQKRISKRNRDLVRVSGELWVTEEHYALFSRYLAARHADGGMTEMDMLDFAAMAEDTPVETRVVEYREGGRDGPLLAACLTDILSDGLSLVYSFFEPTETRRSLGQFMILDHVALARSVGLPYVYLGYWVRGSRKMDYKIRYQPAEILTARGWRRRAPDVEPAPVEPPAEDAFAGEALAGEAAPTEVAAPEERSASIEGAASVAGPSDVRSAEPVPAAARRRPRRSQESA